MAVKVKIKQRAFEEAVARRNMTLGEIAKKLDVSYKYLSNVKNETLPAFCPSAKLRRTIMEVLEVEFDDVFEFDNNKAKKKRRRK